MKKSITSLILALVILTLSACSGNTQPPEVTESTTTTQAEVATETTTSKVTETTTEILVSTTDELEERSLLIQAENEITDLIEKNKLCFYAFVDGTGMELTDAVSGNDRIVKSGFFRNYSELVDCIKSTYTEQKAKEFIENPFGLGKKMFYEEDGIWYATKYVTHSWIGNPFYKGYCIEVLSASENTCEFVFWYRIYKPYADEDEYTMEGRKCKAVKENGEWKLAQMVYNSPELELAEYTDQYVDYPVSKDAENVRMIMSPKKLLLTEKEL